MSPITFKTTSRSHAWAQFKDEERETWQRCDGCGLQVQSAREATAATGMRVGGLAKQWRIKIGEKIFWADYVPACGAGPAWEVKALPPGHVAEQLDAGADQIFFCAGACEMADCDCRVYHGMKAATLRARLGVHARRAVAPIHDGCTCYVTTQADALDRVVES